MQHNNSTATHGESSPRATKSRGDQLLANGHARNHSEAQHIQDAEAFELEGLIDEDEDEDEAEGSTSRKAAHDEESALLPQETIKRS